MVERIDKTRLNKDLRYRFDFVSKFIDFTNDDIKTLNGLESIIMPNLPATIDLIYRKLFSFDTTKHYFELRNDCFENFSPNNQLGLTLDFVQKEFRKDMLTIYLKNIFQQPDWNDAFLEYLSRVGEIHTHKGGSSSIHVDYTYMNGLFCYLEQLLIDIVLNTDKLTNEQKRQGTRAITKFVWIQNDFLTMHYATTWNKDSTRSNIPIVKLAKCFFS